MSCLGSIGVVGLEVVPRRVAGLCPGPRDFLRYGQRLGMPGVVSQDGRGHGVAIVSRAMPPALGLADGFGRLCF
jgi:hypothetical protein